MPKNFHIERPEKCRACQKAEECCLESVTAEGILLCCKSFYYVFCELDKKCRVPFDKVDKMQHYIDNPEDKPFLDPALVTNGTLAASSACMSRASQTGRITASRP
jgi:aspartate/glutamate racemase